MKDVICEEGTDVFRYSCFISYSRQDVKFAAWLHRKLEGLRFPLAEGWRSKWPLRPVFRDTDELAASSDLGQSIRTSLEESGALILLCSPDAAKSEWVNREIEHFLGLERPERLFLVLIRGEPMPNTANNPNGAFPPAIGALDREPLWIDARKSGEPKARVLARVAASLLNVSFDQVWKRQQRRRRLAIAGSSLFGIVLATPVLAASWELSRPIDLNDCPIDSLQFAASWGGERLYIRNSGESLLLLCPHGQVDTSDPVAFARFEEDAFCEGPFGQFVLDAEFERSPDTPREDVVLIYNIWDASPCCQWGTEEPAEFAVFANTERFQLHDSQFFRTLERLPTAVISFQPDPLMPDTSVDDRLLDLTFNPVVCELSLDRRLQLVFARL